jgi:hypothetical protein
MEVRELKFVKIIKENSIHLMLGQPHPGILFQLQIDLHNLRTIRNIGKLILDCHLISPDDLLRRFRTGITIIIKNLRRVRLPM